MQNKYDPVNNLFVCLFLFLYPPSWRYSNPRSWQQISRNSAWKHLKLLLAGIRLKAVGSSAIFDLRRRYSVKLNKLQGIVTFIFYFLSYTKSYKFVMKC